MNFDSQKFQAMVWCVATLLLGVFWFAFASELSARVIVATVGLGFGASLFSLILAVPLLWAMSSSRYRVLYLMLLVSLATVPVYVQVGAWDSIFGKLGWLTLSINDSFTPLVNRWLAAIWIHGVAAVPQVALILWAGLSLGRGQYEEQGLLDTSPAGVFWRVTLRRLIPFGALAVLWVTIACSREIAVTDIYQIGTLAEYIYLGYAMGQGMQMFTSWGSEAQELSVLLQIITLGWFGINAWWISARLLDVEWELTTKALERVVPRRSWIASVLGLAVVFIIFVAPLGNVFVRGSMAVRRIEGVPQQVFEPSNFLATIGRCLRDYQTEFFWSMGIATAGSVIVIVTASLIAFFAGSSRVFRGIFLVLLVTTLALPGPLIGSLVFQLTMISSAPSWIAFFDRTIAAPTLASSLFVWPVVALMVWQVFKGTDRNMLAQAQLDGASWYRQLVSIVWSRSKGIFVGAWGIAFVLILGELSASQMVQIAGVDTLPRLTLGLLHSGVDEKTAAVTFLTMVFGGSLTAIAFLILWSGGRRR
jgi:ABC-type Fe3+ transport system permease subunit